MGSLTNANEVQGCPGWYYGLRIRIEGEGEKPKVKFDVGRYDSREHVGPIVASGYRTTGLARRMGEKKLLGYQHAAQQAIRHR